MISTMIEAALRSLLLALSVWAGLRVFRVRNVLAQKACWGSVLAVSMAMPFLISWSARWQIFPTGFTLVLPRPLAASPGQAAPAAFAKVTGTPYREGAFFARPIVAGRARKPAVPTPAVRTRVAHRQTAAADAIPAVPSAVRQSQMPSGGTKEPPPRGVPVALLLALSTAVYVIAAAVFALRIFYGLGSALVLWLRAQAVPHAVARAFGSETAVRFSHGVSSPVTIGSAVVLPADYSEWDLDKLRVVLAHERSHIRQGDFYLQLLAAFYAAIFWPSPLGWWLKRELSDLAETISDRAGLAQASNRISYAQILLEFAAAPRPHPIGVAMARTGSLTRRIERILNDTAFGQAFAGGRRRVVVAFLLVPAALVAATCLIRVEAAQAPPAAPTPPPQAAPASPALPPAAPAPDAAPVPPPPAIWDASPAAESLEPSEPPLIVLAPPAPAAPLPPGHVVVVPPPAMPMLVTPWGGQAVLVAPAAPPSLATLSAMPVPPAAPRAGVLLGGPFALAQDDKSVSPDGDHSAYSLDSDGDSYAIVRGADRQNYQFSGDLHTTHIEKARKLAHGDFLWFTRDDKEYYVDDPAVMAAIEAMYRPIDALGKQQEELGRKQEELGRQQEALGRQQEQASVPTPDLSEEMANLNAAMAKLQAKAGKTITQDELGEIQEKIGELQAKLGELQGRVGDKQGEFGVQQGRLGEQQGRLGAEQGRLGAEQGKLATEADRKIRSLIDESLHNGKAHPVE